MARYKVSAHNFEELMAAVDEAKATKGTAYRYYNEVC